MRLDAGRLGRADVQIRQLGRHIYWMPSRRRGGAARCAHAPARRVPLATAEHLEAHGLCGVRPLPAVGKAAGARSRDGALAQHASAHHGACSLLHRCTVSRRRSVSYTLPTVSLCFTRCRGPTSSRCSTCSAVLPTRSRWRASSCRCSAGLRIRSARRAGARRPSGSRAMATMRPARPPPMRTGGFLAPPWAPLSLVEGWRRHGRFS